MTGPRTRRCSWEFGSRCHEPAAVRAIVTYLDARLDRDVLFCTPHGERAEELVRPGYRIVRIEALEPVDGEVGVTSDASGAWRLIHRDGRWAELFGPAYSLPDALREAERINAQVSA